MRTFRSQLLLRLNRFLSGQMSCLDIKTWAGEQLQAKLFDPSDALASEVLKTLCLISDENCRGYSVARSNLHYYKNYLEYQVCRHDPPAH